MILTGRSVILAGRPIPLEPRAAAAAPGRGIASQPPVPRPGRPIPLEPRAAATALGREIASMPRGLRLWFAVLLGTIALAVPAALLALPPGWEGLGTPPTFEWGLLIVGYV